MKHTVKMYICLLLTLTLCLLTSCGGADMGNMSAPMEDGYYKEDFLVDDVVSSENTTVTDNRKIIEKSELTVETKAFDDLLSGLHQQLDALGGYVEVSDISGSAASYDSHRYARLTVRVPSDKSDAFTTYITQNSVVTRRNVTTDDVTLQYVDMESRLSALKTEKTALEALLANATTVEDIITVRDRLSDVIGEIESYTAQLRTLDNLVSFTTVSLSIYEVEKTTAVEKQSPWARIGDGFVENLKAVGDGFVEFFVWAVASLPLLIPVAVFAAIVVLIVKLIQRRARKNRAKREKQAASIMPPNEGQ